MKKPFYITTTLPYVNADPHLGHAVEFIRADIIARYKATQGFDVFFNIGTDEHGLKVYRKAVEAKEDPQVYADRYAKRFMELKDALGLQKDVHFIRTTSEQHKKAAQEFWKLCDAAGYIYKKNYPVKYCVGCELEKTESDLVDGKCPIHPNLQIEIINEENYFFKFSAFQKQLLDLYKNSSQFVIPESRLNEIRAFVERGPEDFSISRIASKMPWGVPVPTDSSHVMYVWFDALVSYISTLGWPEDQKNFEKFWKNGTPVQYCGKDNLRQQSAMWQAMLMAAGLPQTSHIVINGFITGEGGVKMSKSLGNVADPFQLVAEYGTDALRYFAAREFSSFEDSPFTPERFKEAYNANLANGLGNFASRVLKMATANGISLAAGEIEKVALPKECTNHLDSFEIQKTTDEIWGLIQERDKFIQDNAPFKKIKVKETEQQAREDIHFLLKELAMFAVCLKPIMPETAETILIYIKENKVPEKPLFPRKD